MCERGEKATVVLVFISLLLVSFCEHVTPSNSHLKTRVETVVKGNGLTDSKAVRLADDAARISSPPTHLRINIHNDLQGIRTLRRLPQVLCS